MSASEPSLTSDEVLILIKVFSAIRDATVREKVIALIKAISASDSNRRAAGP